MTIPEQQRSLEVLESILHFYSNQVFGKNVRKTEEKIVSDTEKYTLEQ